MGRCGSVLLGRPLPVGDTYRALSGFVPVPRAEVAAFTEAIEDGDADEIAILLGEMFRPPRMQNSDGHDLVLHALRWRVPDERKVGTALEASGLRADDATTWTLKRDSLNRSDVVVATLRYEAGELTCDVNSDERAEELRTLVADALPSAELIQDESRSLDEAMADRDPDAPSPALDPADPMVRDVLEQFIAEQERRWLDESIPALEGRTPREAMTDPIGRELLEQLLDSFPRATSDEAAIGMMDADRLRAALGL